MADLSFYLRMSHAELQAERSRLRALELKILAEWLQIEETGQTQYIHSAQANLSRLHAEVRMSMAALKSHEDCEGKAAYEKKHKAAFKAAQVRKQHNIPTLTYYKCPRCKMYHLTSNGGQKPQLEVA